MPINQQVQQKPIRQAQVSTNTTGANSDSPRVTIFTVPTGRKYTVFGVGCDQNAASVRLIAFHIQGTQAVQLVDMPTQRLSTDERVVPLWETFAEGESLTMGLNNGTGGGITPQLIAYYYDEPK